ncbi:hypothetical protein AB7M18_002080 [Pseudomonas viridiflava]
MPFCSFDIQLALVYKAASHKLIGGESMSPVIRREEEWV